MKNRTIPASPNVYLNHIISVLDQETGKAVGESEFIKEDLGSYSETTVKADHGSSWTGKYIMGSRTYVELFTPVARKFKLGEWGMGLGVEEPGGTDSCLMALRGKFRRKVTMFSRKRLIEGQLVPWFRGVQFKPPTSFWIFEYLPDYMDAYKGASMSEEDKISRERYNRPGHDKNGSFLDVEEVTLALGRSEGTILVKALSALGYRIGGHLSRRVCQGPEVKIVVQPKGDSRNGVKSLGMVLRRDLGKKKVSLGNSTISVDGRRAIWEF